MDINSCEACTNIDCLIKKNLGNELVANVAITKKTLRVQKGTQFIIEGTVIQGLYIVYKGVTKISKSGSVGKEQILRFSKNSELIGYRGFGNAPEYEIDAFAVEDSVLCYFTTKKLDQLFKDVPALTYDFMRFYSEELSSSETKVHKLAQMTVREKVIDAILYFNRKFGHQNEYLTLKLSRKDIAGYAGTNEEQVIRVLSSLVKEEMIIKKGKRIGIIDLEKLKSEIAEHNFYISS